MKKIVIKYVSFLLTILLILSLMAGCGKKSVDERNNSITKEEAYNIYYDTIKKFVPELMTTPQECDVYIKTRDEVTFVSEHFVRNTTVKIMSQKVDGKLQYYLLNEFPEANKMNFYYINDGKFYSISSELNKKGNPKEWNSSYIDSFLFPYLNTPLFKLDAIKSFTVNKNGSDTQINFIINGNNMEYGYDQRVMKEIFPSLDDRLDDVKIILTIDEQSVPKTMSTEISMSIFNDSGGLHAKKILNMDFVFNNFDNVAFDLQNVISQHSLDS